MSYTMLVMAEHVITSGEFAGLRLRRRDGEVEAFDIATSRWVPAPLRALARDYGVGEGPWPWLREQGVWRPTPSGRGGASKTHAERIAAGQTRVVVWLTADEHAALEQRRNGRSVRDTIGALLLAAPK